MQKTCATNTVGNRFHTETPSGRFSVTQIARYTYSQGSANVMMMAIALRRDVKLPMLGCLCALLANP
jgi:hypothetical protein